MTTPVTEESAPSAEEQVLEAPALWARPRVLLIAILLVALALRVAHVLAMQANPGFELPTMDALYHVQWARSFAAGESFLEGPFFRAPLYPWLLGSWFALFGESFLAARLAQALLGVLATLATYLLARRAFSTTTGLIASFLVATNWVLIYFDGEFLIPTLIVPLDVFAILLTLEAGARRGGAADGTSNQTTSLASPKKRALLAASAGGLWGLSCIARPNPLLFLPLAFLWLLRGREDSGGRSWRTAVAFAVGVLLPILPITGYNAAQGDTALISTQAGVNFWIGNNPQSDGSTAIVPGTRGGWWEGFEDSIALAEAAEGRELRPTEVSSHYFERALDWVASEPSQALAHFAWKLRLLVTDWELGNNQDVAFFAKRYGVARWLPPGFGLFGGFGLLLGFAVLGLFISRKGALERFPLWGFLAVYSIGILLFFVCSRYRTPLLPIMAVFAAEGLRWLFASFKGAPLRAGASALAVALVAGFSMRIPRAIETSDANGRLQLALYNATKGDLDAAVAEARAAVEADADNRMALRQLGVLLVSAGQPEQALQPLRQALELEARDVDNILAYSDALRQAQRPADARQAAQQAIVLAPHLSSAHSTLGRALYDLGDFAGAAASFEGALERGAEGFNVWFSLASSLERSGRGNEALSAWEKAVSFAQQADPQFADLAQRALEAARARSSD